MTNNTEDVSFAGSFLSTECCLLDVIVAYHAQILKRTLGTILSNRIAPFRTRHESYRARTEPLIKQTVPVDHK